MKFRNESIISSGIHPIMIACRIHAAFLHIHPFHDGNGRVGRSIMALYLVQNGYPPVVFQQFKREKYMNSLYKAQAEKNPTLLYSIVISTILDILMSYQD